MAGEYTSFIIKKRKNIALVAHDNKKLMLVDWVKRNRDILKEHHLCGTGTTARLITSQTGLDVYAFHNGPLGGDQQIGSRIVEGEIDFMVFFWDPLEGQPHDPDVKALLRIAVVYDIPTASNQSTADFLLTSRYMNEEYERRALNYNSGAHKRCTDADAYGALREEPQSADVERDMVEKIVRQVLTNIGQFRA